MMIAEPYAILSPAVRNILWILTDILLAAAILLGIRFYLYMLQLSSYQFGGFFRFLERHRPYIVLHAALAVVWIAVWLLIPSPLPRIILTVAEGILLIRIFFPRKEKKKFVLTSRVGRLIAILAILFILDFAGCLACRDFDLPAGWALWSASLPIVPAFLPLAVALANLLAQPIEKSVRQWYIDDAVRMLREHPGLRIIGITGSFGKTSVKHYLTTMLSEQYAVLMTPGSYNTPMGVVRTIREQLKPTHEIFICEMGARHVGDIKEICDIVHPHDGILTAIGDQHLETFHTRENIIRTKYELLDAVEAASKGESPSVARAAGRAVTADPRNLKIVNGDDEIIAANRKYPEAVTYGLKEGNTYRGEILSVGVSGTTFRVTMPALRGSGTGTAEFTIPLVGAHNVVNVIGAIAVAHMLGVPEGKLKMAARRLQTAAHRLEIKKTPYGAILDDAYNSNPAGAGAALETMAAIARSEAGTDASGREMLKILITPGMVELGEKQAEYNAAFGARAAGICDRIYTVGRTNSDAIREGALRAGFPEDRIRECATLTEAMTLMNGVEPGRRRVLLLENDLTDDYA